MLTVARERVFVAPTLGNLYATLHESAPWGVSTDTLRRRGLEAELEHGVENMKELKRRGVRILPGGDYGFAWAPIGANARDIEHFVGLLGFTPMEAIVAATRLGGEIMGRGHELGQILPGYLADLLLVNGDPLRDVRLLRQHEKLTLVLKGGAVQVDRRSAAPDR